MLRIIKAKTLRPGEIEEISRLWNEEYPVRLNNGFETFLATIEVYSHYLLLNETDNIAGWAIAFRREDETWFSILVSSAYHGAGSGTRLLDALKDDHAELCGWVIDHDNDTKRDGTSYKTPMPFYSKLGFGILPERLETEIISAVKIKWSKGTVV